VLRTRQAPGWLTLDPVAMSGRVVTPPTRDQIDMPPINEQLVIEFYSR
jgi:small subunit ribosomal protein S4